MIRGLSLDGTAGCQGTSRDSLLKIQFITSWVEPLVKSTFLILYSLLAGDILTCCTSKVALLTRVLIRSKSEHLRTSWRWSISSYLFRSRFRFRFRSSSSHGSVMQPVLSLKLSFFSLGTRLRSGTTWTGSRNEGMEVLFVYPSSLSFWQYVHKIEFKSQ